MRDALWGENILRSVGMPTINYRVTDWSGDAIILFETNSSNRSDAEDGCRAGSLQHVSCWEFFETIYLIDLSKGRECTGSASEVQ